MALNVPDLDDRTFEDLLADARKQIPVHDENWTDHNASDPGITILELLTWLAETYNYQLDRVTDEHVGKYLKLLGVEPDPPTLATTTLRIPAPEGTNEDLTGWIIPASTPLVAEEVTGQTKPFETVAPIRMTGATVQRVVSDHQVGRIDNSVADRTDDLSYLAFGPAAEAGSALYLGFDADPFAAATLDLTVVMDDEGLPDPGSHGDEPPDFDPSVALDWEHCIDYSTWYDPDSWAPVMTERDTTNTLYQSGVITLQRPSTWTGEAGSILGQDGTFQWLRCRVRHPEPDDAGYEIPPLLTSIRTNVLAVQHGRHVVREPLVTPDSETETTELPDQVFQFEHGPIRDATITIGGEEWTEVPDFDASGPDDRHYRLDRERGVVRFGNGIRGAVPDAGRSVVARPYSYGGGPAGNVPSSSTWRFAPDALLGNGVFRYYCEPHRKAGMKGALVVGDEALDPEFSDWFEDVPNYDEIVDWRDRDNVTVEVGTEVDAGGEETEPIGISPPAVRVSPGTTVTFRWVSDGHDLAIADQPPESEWRGVPTIQPSGFEASHTFETVSISGVPLPTSGAEGGRDGESLDAALTRLKRDQKRAYRAVTVDDYETIAENTPGLRFGRAAASVHSGPEIEGCEDYCTVTVYLVPHSPKDRPVPSNGFLEAVRCHLERHRLLTDVVAVEPPTYVDVSVSAEVELEPGRGMADRTAAVGAALDEFLDPLAGFDGTGWPFGRTLYRSELYEVVGTVDGIDCVTNLSVSATGEATVESNGDVSIGSDTLFSPDDHDVTVRTETDTCDGGW